MTALNSFILVQNYTCTFRKQQKQCDIGQFYTQLYYYRWDCMCSQQDNSNPLTSWRF